MPDQRGFAGSDRPQEVEAYEADLLVDDIFALADALDLEQFALVGHDWGGAISWTAALRNDPRLTRLAIINAPHPVIFQKSLIEDSDQRAASQYISGFRSPMFEKAAEAMGYDALFEKSFSRHVDLALIPEAERQQYIAEWSEPGGLTAMLNWYRASKLKVPPPGVHCAASPMGAGRLPERGGSDARYLGHAGQGAVADPARRAGPSRRPISRSYASPPPAISPPGKHRDEVVAALLPFLAAEAGASAGAT